MALYLCCIKKILESRFEEVFSNFNPCLPEVKYNHSGNRLHGHKKDLICFNQSTSILCVNRYKAIIN